MRAIVVCGPRDLRLVDVPEPVPGPGEALVGVTHVGICGSDLHYFQEGRVGDFVVREPLVIGHEVVGHVLQDNRPESESLAVGTPVAIHPSTPGSPEPGIEDRPSIWPGGRYLGSAATSPHTQGGARDRMVVRGDQLRVIPSGLDVERAVLAEPLAVALHAVRRAGTVSGARVLVSGAGPIGLLVCGAAVAAGAARVTVSDLLAGPLARARALGAAHTVELGKESLPEESFDIVLECSGAPAAFDQALRAVRRGGRIVQVGLLPGEARTYSLAPLAAREIEVRGSYRFDDEIDDAVQLLAQRPELGHVVTDVFDADDAPAAFERAADGASGKVVLRFAT